MHCSPSSLTPSTAPTTLTFTSAPSVSPTCPQLLPICQYGGYCRQDSDCYPGNYCRLDQMPYYSQCLPNANSYKGSDCLPNFYGNNQPCSLDSDCCDPGAYCNCNSNFRQCQQPDGGTNKCSNPNGFGSAIQYPSPEPVPKPVLRPTTQPIIKPVAKPASKPVAKPVPMSPSSNGRKLICQYAGYCRTSADCVAGNKCNVQSKYYSQCIPDSSTYAKKNCVATFAKCSSKSTKCCDPGAVCTTNLQCAQPIISSGECTNPSGYS